tara:strand:- start:58 stop:741 length:684 start_codon:yes stop_codon:yes gene_type:complete
MNIVEKILRKQTVNLFNDEWYELTSCQILNIKTKAKGYVYFIAGNENYELIKIGYSINLDKRIKQFKTGFSNGVFLVGYFYCEDFIDLEKKLHNKYQSKRKTGEWFKLDKNKVVDFINTNKGVIVNGYYGKDSNIVEGMAFNFSKDKTFFIENAYYEDLFNYIDSLERGKRIIKASFVKNVKNLNKSFSVLSPKKINLVLKSYCKNKGYSNIVEGHSGGDRYFLLPK